MIRRVTAVECDGSCFTLTIGLTEIPYLSMSYSDNVAPEWVYETGSQVPTADTPGQYKPGDGKLKLRNSVARAIILPNLPQFGAANAKTQAVCNFLHPDVGADSDLLEDFRILGGAASFEASAKAAEIELSIRYRLVRWTDRRICFGNPRGGGAIGTLRL